MWGIDCQDIKVEEKSVFEQGTVRALITSVRELDQLSQGCRWKCHFSAGRKGAWRVRCPEQHVANLHTMIATSVSKWRRTQTKLYIRTYVRTLPASLSPLSKAPWTVAG